MARGRRAVERSASEYRGLGEGLVDVEEGSGAKPASIPVVQ